MKQYNRNSKEFQATLLRPANLSSAHRLMTPAERARLVKQRVKLNDLRTDTLAEVLSEVSDVSSPEEVAQKLFLALEDAYADALGPYADYPDDFNFLASALGSVPVRYENWTTKVGELILTPGVSTIFAETGAGKTTMADLLCFNMLDKFDQDTSKVMRIKFGESGSDLETFLRFSELAESLPEQLPPLIIIDSIRLQTFDMGGASRSLSISNKLFRWLTELDVFAIGSGISVILVMNPLAGEEDKIAQFRSDVESSVMSIIDLTSWNTGKFKHRGPENGRQWAQFSIPGEITREVGSQTLEKVVDTVVTAESNISAATGRSSSTRVTAYGRQRSKPL